MPVEFVIPDPINITVTQHSPSNDETDVVLRTELIEVDVPGTQGPPGAPGAPGTSPTGTVIGPSTSVIDNSLPRFDGTTGLLIQGGTNPITVSDTGSAYIGVAGVAIGSIGTLLTTSTSDLTSNVIIHSFQAVGSAPAAGNIQALQFNATDNGAANVGTITGINGISSKSGSGSITTITAVQGATRVLGTVTATTINAIVAQIRVQGTASATTAIDFNASASTVAGTIGSHYGLKIAAKKITGVTTGYGIGQDGTNDLNYFLGKVGFGTNAPSTSIEVLGGDIKLSTAASGIILTSPDGTHYKLTVSNAGVAVFTAV